MIRPLCWIILLSFCTTVLLAQEATIKPGQAYNADTVAETTKAFTDYFGTFGFAFAKVDAVPEIMQMFVRTLKKHKEGLSIVD